MTGEFERWISSPALSAEEISELAAIRGDARAIEDRFCRPLDFGTAGLRGIMQTGLNRMNVHVVRHVTRALAAVLLSSGGEAAAAGVGIAYDCRENSRLFAEETAAVLAANGINVKMFDALRPTPELSFLIREYGLAAGVNVTASHNTREYNGYKVYWSDGAQITDEIAARINREREKTDLFHGFTRLPFGKTLATGRIEIVGDDIDRQFIDMVKCQSVQQGTIRRRGGDFKIVYTPFHGAGYRLIPQTLSEMGFKRVYPVPGQSEPDGAFPTVKSPNPENPEGFALAIKYADEIDADLIIGSDPDADRIGVLARNKNGEMVPLTGNQTGVLLADYIIRARKTSGTMPRNPALVKSVVTTPMTDVVAEQNGVTLFESFTGFKNICEKIAQIEDKYHFIFAFEESCGYMAGDHARDKDAVTAALLTAEAATWYDEQDMTLIDAIEALYRKYGHFAEKTVNVPLPGASGAERMAEIMAKLRSDPPQSMGGILTLAVRDYLKGERYVISGRGAGQISATSVKGENMLYFEMEDDVHFAVRPSGTEPKIKAYVMARGRTNAECAGKIEHYRSFATFLLR